MKLRDGSRFKQAEFFTVLAKGAEETLLLAVHIAYDDESVLLVNIIHHKRPSVVSIHKYLRDRSVDGADMSEQVTEKENTADLVVDAVGFERVNVVVKGALLFHSLRKQRLIAFSVS